MPLFFKYIFFKFYRLTDITFTAHLPSARITVFLSDVLQAIKLKIARFFDIHRKTSRVEPNRRIQGISTENATGLFECEIFFPRGYENSLNLESDFHTTHPKLITP